MTLRKTKRLLGLAIVIAWPSAWPSAADWPTYRHDNQRSAITAGIICQRLAYDHAYHVTAVGDRVFYGSSAEHTVHCLDAYSGAEQWVFFTDGPVRFAPTIDNGRVYAGSDDGTAYCLDAATGKLIWNHTAASEKNVLVPNDGRLVSPWSVRSSVAVDGGTAFFTSGFFPHEGVYMSAVDAITGRATGRHHWKQHHLNKGSFQGYMLLSDSRIYMPGGRSTPFYFDRRTGKRLGQFAKGNGMGSFALLADNRIFHGPADRSGGVLTEAGLTGDKAASHTVARLSLSIYFVGSAGRVRAFNAHSGRKLWSEAVPGRALGLAVANGALLVSTDTGAIISFGQADDQPSAWILF